jgi:hypothetical protein
MPVTTAVEVDAGEVTGVPDGRSPVAVTLFVVVWVMLSVWHSYWVTVPAASLLVT